MKGLCECGCGAAAPVAARTHGKYGYIKGQPMRFIRGHAMRGRKLTPEHRERVGAAHRGKPKSAQHRARISAAQRGELGPNWQGGIIEREGRRLVYAGREHAMADSYGYVYEHRLIAAQSLGRPLLPSEHVHHVDLDPTNNSPDNLAILTASAHRRLHNLIMHEGLTPADALDAVCA